MPEHDFSHALRCAQHYRKLGLCPLPSRMDRKRPDLDSYADYWEKPVPEEVYDPASWRTTNIQLMTGTKTPGATKLVVVDCDGEAAIQMFEYICSRNSGYIPGETWTVRTGSGGWHHYFRLPDGADECPSGMIWGLWDTYGDDGRGKWVEHTEIRILGDNALAVAPPSIHVDTGKPYEFLGSRTPRDCPLPEIVPDWILEMPRLASPRCVEPPAPKREPVKAAWKPTGASYRREEVLGAIGDQKLALAQSWGLRPASRRPNPNGWVSCYAVGREDNHPSASFHWADGTYQDRKDLRSISLFDLAVELGAFATWQECRDYCGDRFLGRRAGPSHPHSHADAKREPTSSLLEKSQGGRIGDRPSRGFWPATLSASSAP